MRVEIPIKNFEAQQKIFDAPQNYVIVPKGRRFGLTVGAANNFIKKALERKYSKGLWGDVVNSNIEKYIQRLFLPKLKNLPPTMWKWSKNPHVVYILDSYIDFRSAERPESWEGFGYEEAFLNEAGIILKNEYLYENAIKPMFWDNNCHVIVGGTPKGKGKFFELYQRGLDKEQEHYVSFKFTSFDNPYINHQRIMEDIKDMPEKVVKQEIYAEFLDDTGVVFSGVTEVTTLEPQEPIPGHIYVIGCDLAKVQDFTVLTVFDRKTNHQVYQMRFNQLEYPFIRSKIKELSRKYNNALVILDSTGVGEPTFDDLSRELVPVEPYRFTNESKKNLIEKLSNWIELKYLRLLNIEDTINELNSFTYDYSEKTGRVIYGAPVGFHDDIVCFTKGTKILTSKGQVDIEKIKIGDLVLTRKGYKPIINTFCRDSEVITNSQLGLTGTSNHPVFTAKGIKPLSKVRDTDIIYMWNEKLSNIEERSTTDILTQKEDNLGSIFGGMISGKSLPLRYIDRFGLTILGKYLTDVLFTIKTGILLIINQTTYNSWNAASTTDNICWSLNSVDGLVKMERSKQQNYLLGLKDGEKKTQNWHTNLQYITEKNKHRSYLQQEINGEKKTQKKHINWLSKMVINMESIMHTFWINGEKKTQNWLKMLLFWQTKKHLLVKRTEKVYNLTVADVPEYFANNILVHNCSIGLAVSALQPISERVKVEQMSVIQRDLYEKKNQFKDQENGTTDPFEYEEV